MGLRLSSAFSCRLAGRAGASSGPAAASQPGQEPAADRQESAAATAMLMSGQSLTRRAQAGPHVADEQLAAGEPPAAGGAAPRRAAGSQRGQRAPAGGSVVVRVGGAGRVELQELMFVFGWLVIGEGVSSS
jgi:hypothetical protein